MLKIRKLFFPNLGKSPCTTPPGGHGIRMDSHLYTGFTVSPYYDSLIGKLITYAETRDMAIRKMLNALDELVIEGIQCNAELHQQLLQDPLFCEGGQSIHYLEQWLENQKATG